MVSLELRAQAPLGQLFLQVSVKLQRVVLRHHDANLLVLRGEIPQYALRHALQPRKD